MLMTKTSIETGLTIALNLETLVSDKSTLPFEYLPCIYHLMWFKKDQAKFQALLDSGNKVNTMTPAHATKLNLKVQPIDVKAWKINNSTLLTFEMILVNSQVKNKLKIARFF